MIRLTKHAQEALSARDIVVDWIEAAVSAPDWIEPDPRHPDRIRSYKAIAGTWRPGVAGCASTRRR
jgi:Domain of unknown function (DUF4258)